MNGKYTIAKDKGVKNIIVDGEAVGYYFYGRVPYYMAAQISAVTCFKVFLDGVEEEPADISLTIDGNTSYTVPEMPTVIEFWPYGIPQKVTVMHKGGIAPGKHILVFKVGVGVIYGKAFSDAPACTLEFEI